jgi:outer membrane protein
MRLDNGKAPTARKSRSGGPIRVVALRRFASQMRQRLIVGAVLFALAAAAPAQAEVRLAYVDIQRALNECAAGKRAKTDFRSRVQVIEAKLQKQQNRVQALKDELDKKGMLMKPDERQNLQDEYLDKLKDFQRNYKDSKDELTRRDNEITNRIIHDLALVVRELAEKNGYTMVMEKGSILWGSPGIDITSQVIRTYDAMHVKPGTLGMGFHGTSGASTAQAPESGGFGSSAVKRSTISR